MKTAHKSQEKASKSLENTLKHSKTRSNTTKTRPGHNKTAPKLAHYAELCGKLPAASLETYLKAGKNKTKEVKKKQKDKKEVN